MYICIYIYIYIYQIYLKNCKTIRSDLLTLSFFLFPTSFLQVLNEFSLGWERENPLCYKKHKIPAICFPIRKLPEEIHVMVLVGCSMNSTPAPHEMCGII
jgi:hypothetical protein